MVGVFFLGGATRRAADAGVDGGDGAAGAEAGVVAGAAAGHLVADAGVAARDAGWEAAEGATWTARTPVAWWALCGGEGEEGGCGVDGRLHRDGGLVCFVWK